MQDTGGMPVQRPQTRATPWKENLSPVHSQPSYIRAPPSCQREPSERSTLMLVPFFFTQGPPWELLNSCARGAPASKYLVPGSRQDMPPARLLG